jgi:hypothetical protein
LESHQTNAPKPDFTYQASWREIHNERNDIDCQLKLHKLLNVDVHWSTPFGNSNYGGKVVIENNNIGTLFCHLQTLKRKWWMSSFN